MGGVSTRVIYKYRIFASTFFKTCDAYAAYDQAGFKARSKQSRINGVANLFARPTVQKILQEEFAKLQARLELQQDRTMLEICRVAYSDMRGVARWGPWGLELTDSKDLPADVAATVQDVRSKRKVRTWVNEQGEPVTEEDVDTQIKLHPKIPGLRMLQEFFRRGDPLSAEAEAKVHALLMIMAQYVPRDRLDAFRAHVRAAFGIDIPDGDGPAPGTPKLNGRGPGHGGKPDASGRNGAPPDAD